MPHFHVCPCALKLVCSWLSPHDALYLVGSIPLLGTWQPSAGIRLRASERDYPCWGVQVILPCDVDIEYKYVAVRGNEVIWEQSANRVLRLNSHSFVLCRINDGTFGINLRLSISDPVRVEPSFDFKRKSPRSPRRTLSRDHLAQRSEIAAFSLSDSISEESETELPTVFVIDRELPFECCKGSDGDWILTPKEQTAGSRLASLRQPYDGQSPYNVRYIGSPGFYVPESDQSSLAAALLEVQCFPVFMQSEAQETSYKEYISSVLLPSFASVHAPAGSISATDDEVSRKLWKEYVQVNKLFASVFSAHGEKTASYAWVLGYELLLVPQYIRQLIKYEKHSEVKIIFWLLQPFPPSETFSSLHQRLPLLQSLLAADLVEFDLFDYCRHFMHCCRRLLNAACMNIEGGFLGVEYDNRAVFLRSSPSGVLSTQFNDVLRSKQFQVHRSSFLELTQDCQCVLVSYDSYDRLAGILLKLMAWKSFLDDLSSNHLPSRKSYRLVLMCIEPREVLPGHDDYRAQVQSCVADIKKRHPNSLVFIPEDSHVSFARKLALFSVGDVLVNSYVRQGVDPSPLEYILVNDYIKNPDNPEHAAKPATIILSEFTSYSRLLSRADRINPWDTKSFVNAIDNAVCMTRPTRLLNHAKHMENIQSLDFVKWARSVITDTMQSVTHDTTMLVSSSISTPTLFSAADVSALATNFSASRTRFISVVWDRFFYSKYAREIAENLIQLSQDACNIICILYSGSRSELELHFPAALSASMSIFCEFGVQEKAPGSATKWTNLYQSSQDLTWKAQTMRIMNQYSSRTDGSLPPRATECSITWDYSHVDPELAAIQVFSRPVLAFPHASLCFLTGFLQSKGLVKDLQKYSSSLSESLQIMDTAGRISVFPSVTTSHSLSIARCLAQLPPSQSPEFALCLADDSLDVDV
jgi:trehalose 6-phosphate synthase